MSNKYTLGNTVVITAIFEKLSDPFASPPTYAVYDPATPTLTLQRPDATEILYTYPASGQITKPASTTGRYFGTIKPDMAGTWRYQWKDPDAVTPGLIEGSFTVAAAKV